MLDELARRLLDGTSFGTVATLNPDGAPQTSVVWLAREGDRVVFSTTSDRRKARNLARDPRVSVTVFDVADPYTTVEIRGRAELTEDPERELPKRMAAKYGMAAPPPEPPGVVRLIVTITPEKTVTFID